MSKRKIGFLSVSDEHRVDPTYKERKSRASSSGKRTRDDAFDLAEEYVCPITQELPINPVMLADGRCYEKAAIEEHIKRNGHDGVVRSPVTNLEISAQLIPALLARNTLSRLIDQGVIKGEKADVWKAATQKIEDDRKHLERVKGLAAKGNVRAMEDLGSAYEQGDWGLEKNEEMAYAWFLRAGRNGNAAALTRAAICHLNGTGVARQSHIGMCMAHEAATMGSEHACSLIAMGYATGRWGLDEIKADAAYWYGRAKRARIRDTPEECRKRGDEYIAAHGHEMRLVDRLLGPYNNDSGEDDD